MPLPPISRRRTCWPFAKGSSFDSIGEYRGVLYPALLGGGILCWDARGEACRIFNESLKPPILNFLDKNSDKIHESDSFLSIPLFMVGKRPERAKPVVLFVSDDKGARKEAFDMVKGSGILEDFPDFELGHADLGKIMALAGDMSPVLCEVLNGDGRSEVLQLFRNRESKGEDGRRATAGGVIEHCGRCMILTVNHFLADHLPKSARQPQNSRSGKQQQPGSEPDSDGCEITGLDDFDDEEQLESGDGSYTHSVDVTSQASLSDLEGSDLDSDNDMGSFRTKGLSASSSSESNLSPQPETEIDRSGPATNEPSCSNRERGLESRSPAYRDISVGNLVVGHQKLDYALIEVEIDELDLDHIPKILEDVIPFETNEAFVAYLDPLGAAVWIMTAHAGRIEGTISPGVHHIRLPGLKAFTEVYLATFSQPLSLGDCGAWVRDASTKRLYGHIIAGSLTDGHAVIVPARHVFSHARSLNKQPRLAQPSDWTLSTSQLDRDLIDAVLSRKVSEVDMCLRAGADPNVQIDSRGTTTMHYAAFHCDIELLPLLKEAGAIINARQVYSHTMLFLAICGESRLTRTRPSLFRTKGWLHPDFKTNDKVLEAIKLIFLAPSTWKDLADSLDKPDRHGVTPLMAAAELGLDKTIAYLLARGADPNKTDKTGANYQSYLKSHGGTSQPSDRIIKPLPSSSKGKKPTAAQNHPTPSGTMNPPSSSHETLEMDFPRSELNSRAETGEYVNELVCEFHSFANCDAVFDLAHEEHWANHTLGHLRKDNRGDISTNKVGRQEKLEVHSGYNRDHLPPAALLQQEVAQALPNLLSCWFCDEAFASEPIDDPDSQVLNFRRRMVHIFDHISRGTARRDQVRADPWVTQHWSRNDRARTNDRGTWKQVEGDRGPIAPEKGSSAAFTPQPSSGSSRSIIDPIKWSNYPVPWRPPAKRVHFYPGPISFNTDKLEPEVDEPWPPIPATANKPNTDSSWSSSIPAFNPPHTPVSVITDPRKTAVLWCGFDSRAMCNSTFKPTDVEVWIDHHIQHFLDTRPPLRIPVPERYRDSTPPVGFFQEGVGGLRLTAESLRKARRLSLGDIGEDGKEEEDGLLQTRTTRPTADDGDVTIRVKGNAVVEVGGAKMKCADGTEINISTRSTNSTGRWRRVDNLSYGYSANRSEYSDSSTTSDRSSYGSRTGSSLSSIYTTDRSSYGGSTGSIRSSRIRSADQSSIDKHTTSSAAQPTYLEHALPESDCCWFCDSKFVAERPDTRLQNFKDAMAHIHHHITVEHKTKHDMHPWLGNLSDINIQRPPYPAYPSRPVSSRPAYSFPSYAANPPPPPPPPYPEHPSSFPSRPEDNSYF